VKIELVLSAAVCSGLAVLSGLDANEGPFEVARVPQRAHPTAGMWTPNSVLLAAEASCSTPARGAAADRRDGAAHITSRSTAASAEPGALVVQIAHARVGTESRAEIDARGQA
jgi:hypothetical protein